MFYTLLILASLQQLIVSRSLSRDKVSNIISSIQDSSEEDEPGLWLAKKEDYPDSPIDNGLYGRSLAPAPENFNTNERHIEEFTATLILLNQQMNKFFYNNKLSSRTKRQNKKVKELGMSTDWCSPAFFVPKADMVRVRLVTDYTHLKKYVKRPVHPFPGKAEILQAIPSTATCFAKLDTVHGYFQLALEPKGSLITVSPHHFPLESIQRYSAHAPIPVLARQHIHID